MSNNISPKPKKFPRNRISNAAIFWPIMILSAIATKIGLGAGHEKSALIMAITLPLTTGIAQLITGKRWINATTTNNGARREYQPKRFLFSSFANISIGVAILIFAIIM